MPAKDTAAREKVGKVEMDFMAVSCCLLTLRLWLSKSAERHRRPPLDLRIVPFAPELGDGVQVPPAGTLGMPLPLAGEFGIHLRGGCVPLMPFFGEFGTHVPEDVPSMPFFGGSLALAFEWYSSSW
jgi:hypothetical protein